MSELQFLCSAFVVAFLASGARYVHRLARTARWHRGDNDDDTVYEVFSRLLQNATTDMIIHDDGDDTPGSMYNEPRVIADLRQHTARGVVVRIYFNQRAALAVNELAQERPERVIIRYNAGERPVDDVHYKIIDQGRQGYLSRHRAGSRRRRYEVINCLRSPERERSEIFGRYLERFERDFAAAAA